MTDPISTHPAALEQYSFEVSAMIVREHLAREEADRTIKRFIEHFAEKGFFPQGDDSLVLALLPQLAQWPDDLSLELLDKNGSYIAVWLKGTDNRVIKNKVSLVLQDDGGYAAQGQDYQPNNDPEAFFKLILSLLPVSSELGTGGSFHGSETTDGRIVTLREQVVELAKSKRLELFDALVADPAQSKKLSGITHPNPFLPFWTQPPADPVLNKLMAYHPQVPLNRFEALLEVFAFSDKQTVEYLKDDTLPEDFVEALEQTTGEFYKHRAIDGVYHTRTYDVDADELAQELGKRLLRERFGYELIVIEPWDAPYESGDADDTAIVLRHNGKGSYARIDEINPLPSGPDSFYQTIGSALKPDERASLGMQSKTDVGALRTVLGNLAADDNGGWFNPESPREVSGKHGADWFERSSSADKREWEDAVHAHRLVLLDVAEADFPELATFKEREELRNYARQKLRERLKADLGLDLNPDEISIRYFPVSTGDPADSLTDVSLKNVSFFDLAFKQTAYARNAQEEIITALTASYLYDLVRELDVGESYSRKLKAQLLTSAEGRRDQKFYTNVMAAQMRVDAIEAKMAGAFLPDQTDRGYKWVQALLDQPVDDGTRPLVDKHRIQVQRVTYTYRPYDGGSYTGSFEGMLIIAPEASRSSVESLVLYAPSAPRGVRFREYSSHEAMARELLGNIDVQEYLLSRASAEEKPGLSLLLDKQDNEGRISVTAQAPITPDFYFSHYEADVERIVTKIDELTKSTDEQNWEDVWKAVTTIGIVVDVAMLVTPFKVGLALSFIRSVLSVAEGIQRSHEGEPHASVHFLFAALFWLPPLPGLNGLKIKPSIKKQTRFIDLEKRPALEQIPDGLQLRTDGGYNGVSEITRSGATEYYLVLKGKAYSVKPYDGKEAKDGLWKLMKPGDPDSARAGATTIKRYGPDHWDWAPAGLQGGMPLKVPKNPNAPKTKKAMDEARRAKKEKERAKELGVEVPVPGPASASGETHQRRLVADVQNYLSQHVDEEVKGLNAAINKAVEAHRDRAGRSDLKKLKGLDYVYEMDLPRIGQSTGRGDYRLILVKSDEGTVVAVAVKNHKGVANITKADEKLWRTELLSLPQS